MAKRTEAGDWTKFFGLLIKLAPSPAVRDAARLVFGEGEPVTPRKQEPLDRSLLALTRMVMFQRFEATYPETSAAQVYRVLKIDKSNWYRWRRGELPGSSTIAQRIESYLTKV